MDTWFKDLRYGVRMLARQPGYTAVAVLTLALGIGATTAIFTVVDAVLLQPLPYPEPDRLIQMGRGFPGNPAGPASSLKFQFWRENNQTFEALTAFESRGYGFNLSGDNRPEYVKGLRVSADFFTVLGVMPAPGRAFTPDEDRVGGERVVILSEGLWRRRFGADAGLVGQTIQLSNEPWTVIGVMPPNFQFTPAADLWVPLRAPLNSKDGSHNYTVIGRLKPGITPPQAQADLDRLAEDFRAAHPNMMFRAEFIAAQPYSETLASGPRPMLLMLLGAVAFVLLIACANVANLLLTRAAFRRKEMAIRLALGADWRRVMRQLLTEGLLLALAGGALGLLLAFWGVDVLNALMPAGTLPRSEAVGVNSHVLLFTLGVAIFSVPIFALAPALQAARVDLNHALRDGAGRTSAGGGGGRLRNVLVIAEVALALVLLAGAGLMIRTVINLRQVNAGFDPRNVLTFQATLSDNRYGTAAQTADFLRRATDRLKSLPGVEAAAVTSNLPLDTPLNMAFAMEDSPDKGFAEEFRMITPDYFQVMKITLKQGRAFTDADAGGSEKVAIINEAFARRYFPDGPAVGSRVLDLADNRAPRTIIGLVGDVKQFGMGKPAPPTVFVPIAQVPDGVLRGLRRLGPMNFVVRAAGDPLALAAAAEREVLSTDPTQAVSNLRAMEQVLAASLATERFIMSLLGVFAAVGLLLAAVGIYGVISYGVAQRTREIGLRMALGARPGDVLRMVLGQGVGLAALGIAAGLGAAFGLTRLLAGLLFGVSPVDPATFAGMALVFAAVAGAASYLPARRATRVDPMAALRHE